jgi:hypothetical protein
MPTTSTPAVKKQPTDKTAAARNKSFKAGSQIVLCHFAMKSLSLTILRQLGETQFSRPETDWKNDLQIWGAEVKARILALRRGGAARKRGIYGEAVPKLGGARFD